MPLQTIDIYLINHCIVIVRKSNSSLNIRMYIKMINLLQEKKKGYLKKFDLILK